MIEMNICGLDKHSPDLSGTCTHCKTETCVHMGHRIKLSDFRGMPSHCFYCHDCFKIRVETQKSENMDRLQRRDYLSWAANEIKVSGNADKVIRDEVLRTLINEILDITTPKVNLQEG